jgi:lauroyl/myristoyl acyltransferase
VHEGRGIVFLTPHLGCFEVTAQAYAELFGPITVLYRPARKAWLRDLVATARAAATCHRGAGTLSGVRQMLQNPESRPGRGPAADQVPPQGLGVWAPFFGKPAYTMTLAARLVQQTGAGAAVGGASACPRPRATKCTSSREGGKLPRRAVQAAARINAQMERLVRDGPSSTSGAMPATRHRARKHRQDVISRLVTGGILFMRAAGPLPLSWTRALGCGSAGCCTAVVGARRHVVDANLAPVFPQWSEDERRRRERADLHPRRPGLAGPRLALARRSGDLVRRRVVHLTGALDELAGRDPTVVFAPHFVGMDAGVDGLTLQMPRPSSAIYTRPATSWWTLDAARAPAFRRRLFP